MMFGVTVPKKNASSPVDTEVGCNEKWVNVPVLVAVFSAKSTFDTGLAGVGDVVALLVTSQPPAAVDRSIATRT